MWGSVVYIRRRPILRQRSPSFLNHVLKVWRSLAQNRRKRAIFLDATLVVHPSRETFHPVAVFFFFLH